MIGINVVISALAGARASAQAVERYVHGVDFDRYHFGDEKRTPHDFDLTHSEED